jgi:ribosomal protein L21
MVNYETGTNQYNKNQTTQTHIHQISENNTQKIRFKEVLAIEFHI